MVHSSHWAFHVAEVAAFHTAADAYIVPVDWHTYLADLHTCSAEASYLAGRWAAVAVVVDRHFDMLDDLLETDIRLVLAD